MIAELFALRYQVYCLECGFLDPKAYADELETDEYDTNAVHFTAHNRDKELVGSVRLVLAGIDRHFPFQDHCTELFDDVFLPPPQESAEVSRLVVKENYRRRVGDNVIASSRDYLIGNNLRLVERRVSGDSRSSSPQILLGLYREMYQYSVQTNIRFWYAAMEKSLARVLARLQFQFKPIGRETDYYGPVMPYVADLRELERRLAENNPALLDWFRAGRCLVGEDATTR